MKTPKILEEEESQSDYSQTLRLMAESSSPARNTTVSATNQSTLSLGIYGDLPLGWEAKQTPTGQTYYVDHSTKKTKSTRMARSFLRVSFPGKGSIEC